MTDREIISKIYNLIATQTNYDNRTDIEKRIINWDRRGRLSPLFFCSDLDVTRLNFIFVKFC